MNNTLGKPTAFEREVSVYRTVRQRVRFTIRIPYEEGKAPDFSAEREKIVQTVRLSSTSYVWEDMPSSVVYE